MPHLIKRSRNRLIISGNLIEHIEYEKPFFYNFSPIGERGGARKKSSLKRDDSLARTRNSIRRLTNANANQYGEKLKFFTFTFKENVTDVDEALAYWKLFIRDFRSRFGVKLKYITVIEFQIRGAVHFHTLFFNMPFTYGLKTLCEESWTWGFIKIKAIDHVVNCGAYISKYLTKSKFDKRLNGKKSYFTSRGLKKPLLFRNKKTVLKKLQFLQRGVEFEESFESKTLGIIKYKQGSI